MKFKKGKKYFIKDLKLTRENGQLSHKLCELKYHMIHKIPVEFFKYNINNNPIVKYIYKGVLNQAFIHYSELVPISNKPNPKYKLKTLNKNKYNDFILTKEKQNV